VTVLKKLFILSAPAVILCFHLSIFCATAWAGLTGTEVSQLYVLLFGRASEGQGNTYRQTFETMDAAAANMLATPEARDYFGANLNTNQAFVEHIYQNTLNKTISDDYDGIRFWVQLLGMRVFPGTERLRPWRCPSAAMPRTVPFTIRMMPQPSQPITSLQTG
jgi:hypothetical protein